jgi:molybdopterin converting factor small subunit
MVTVAVYQPIASILGYQKPGGFKFITHIEKPVTLAKIFELNEKYGRDLINNLSGNPPKVTVTIAVNGKIRRDGLLTRVDDGDEISILPVYLGG